MSNTIMLRGSRSLALREGFFYAYYRTKSFGILSCVIVVMAVTKLLNKVFDNRDNGMPIFYLISKCFKNVKNRNNGKHFNL